MMGSGAVHGRSSTNRDITAEDRKPKIPLQGEYENEAKSDNGGGFDNSS